MIIEALTNIGAIRENNEDAVFGDVSLGLAAVADGIGGHMAGEIASQTAIDILASKIKEAAGPVTLDILKEAFFAANHLIYTLGKKDDAKHGMGTTLTVAYFDDKEIKVVHVGDSRAYLCAKDKAELLTNDHSVAGELVKDGNITKEEAAHHPQRNILTRSLGAETLVKVDEIIKPWYKGDTLLLCSDGLYNQVTDEEMASLLKESESLKTACQKMVDTALSRGGYDNISVVIARNC